MNVPQGIPTGRPTYWSAVSLALGVAISIGYARFAYALILPDMRTDLVWSYSQAGLPNTWNALGNILGAIFALVVSRRLEPRWTFSLGVLLASLALLATGASSDMTWISFFRFLAGVGGSAAFASGGALVAKKFDTAPERSGTAITIYFGGGGFGIILAAIGIPLLSQHVGPGSWSYSWMFLGVLAIVCAIPPLLTAFSIRIPVVPVGSRANYSLAGTWPMLCSYACFGAGYIVYMTFSFAWMREHEISMLVSSLVWVLLGLMAMFSFVLWRGAMTRWHPSRVMAASTFMASAASAIPMFSSSYAMVICSGAIFGACLMMAPAAMTAFTRRHFPVSVWAAVIAIFTIVFSLFQAISPALAGAVADRTRLEAGFAVGSGLLFASCLLSLLQRRVFDHERNG